jgi:hypothetical protein
LPNIEGSPVHCDGFNCRRKATGYRCTLREDAEITRYFILNIAKFNEFALLSHDRGDSVARFSI